jgi:hypothetical protein
MSESEIGPLYVFVLQTSMQLEMVVSSFELSLTLFDSCLGFGESSFDFVANFDLDFRLSP